MGSWTFNYDTLNRLSEASITQLASSGPAASLLPNYCWNYDNFGNRLMQEASSLAFQSGSGESCAPSPTEHLFTGKERDAESGNDYIGARYYASSMGRWMSPDSLNLTDDRVLNPANTLNKYAYGANNPLKYLDMGGKDITIFYTGPSILPPGAGHIILLAENQQTGDAAVSSFGPNREGISGAVNTLVGNNMPTWTPFDSNMNAAGGPGPSLLGTGDSDTKQAAGGPRPKIQG